MSQLDLLRSRRFLPLFLTQFLGAFNDNVYKNALVILITFHGAATTTSDATLLVVASAGLFILPFFLFSALAGQLADRYAKPVLVRAVKVVEVLIMALAGVGLALDSVPFLMLVLFLMATQSTLFGPLKYGLLPEHLETRELTGGNGLIQMGTFLAILLGTVFGGVLAAEGERGAPLIAGSVLAIALLGWLSARRIPPAPPAAPRLAIRWNIVLETARMIAYAWRWQALFLPIIAISWFWFLGATYLSLMPALGKGVLGSGAHVVTLLLTAFSLGIGVGSVSCERLSRGAIELGLVPIGALGISLFGLDLYVATRDLAPSPGELLGMREFLAEPRHWRVLLDLSGIALFGGLYIVPLYAEVQYRSPPEHRARVIAAANILNALFMVASAALTFVLVGAGVALPRIFLLLGLLNLAVLAWVLRRRPGLLRRTWALWSRGPA